ncbi:GNAT family N-acetyltransferase [Psychromarinibacter sp. C21-152]|uniref:GNAT family N-acetyltransferase n=1 Tax=Psychromarinibacter sediminicola TaxID=3033385 RepID=A0AAE3TA69_9RHOB|nr:GNAT family N-acetyltransferase [Psychromarinibacter sediminicola]MDF0602962.1 GNAT family N-acetyltransferase [Psychromarinibacter sediminicola]
MTVTIRDTGGAREATEKRVLGLLDAHSEALGLPFVIEHIALEAWDGDSFLGGLTARMTQEWVFLALLAVSEAARGRGIGRQLMGALEQAARDRGATGIWLDTFSFQAPAFYEGLGYAVFGQLPDMPAGHTRYFLMKRLDGAG